jgi:drug/metabolite transporter (DMT)-like permease
MQNTNAISALLVSSGVAAVILGVATVLSPAENITVGAVLFFAAAGLVGDGVGRFSMLGAVDRLGPSIAIPIQTAAYPLIAVVGGIVILSEDVTLAQLIGAVTVVAGIWVLLLRGSDTTESLDSEESPPIKHSWLALALPVLAGVGFAASDLLRKTGLEDTPSPAFGAMIAVSGMLILVSVGAVLIPRLRRIIRVGPG